VGAVAVQAVEGAAVHAGGNVHCRDGADMREALQQVRPDFAGAGHEVVTLQCLV